MASERQINANRRNAKNSTGIHWDWLDDEISDTYASAEWAADGRTLFYTRMDDAQRPDRLLRHRLGQDPARDAQARK